MIKDKSKETIKALLDDFDRDNYEVFVIKHTPTDAVRISLESKTDESDFEIIELPEYAEANKLVTQYINKAYGIECWEVITH